MAVTNKDFKIKYGLVVEGATGTINGEDILTKGAGDQYIINLIGGSATPNNTPDTVVLRDADGDFAAGTVTVNRVNIGSVGYIEDDGSIEIVNTDGDDINIAADDIRLRAADDVQITSGNDGSPSGDISLTTNGGNIRFQAADVYLGTNIGFTDAERVATQGYVDQAELDAVSSANSHTDTALLDYTTTANLDAHIDGHLSGGDGISYSAGTISADVANGLEITDGHIVIDRDTVDTWYDAAGSADALINDASTSSTEVWSAYKTSTEIGLAQAAAEGYADGKIADLVNGAPELLDTLNELAAALEDNPDVIADLRDIADGKQNTLTAGDNISILNDVVSVTGLDSADISDFNTAALSATASAYDAAGSASAAQQNAEEYADALINDASNLSTQVWSAYKTSTEIGLAQQAAIDHADALTTDDVEEGFSSLYFTDSRARGSAGDLLAGAITSNVDITYVDGVLSITAENGVADSTTSDLEEGSNLYFTDERAIDAVSGADIYPNAVIINNLTKHVASQLTVATAGIATGISWAKADYRSAEFVVKVAYGNHTEISKVLLTLDVNDNIAITEYGNVTTNGSASSISADISGTDARLRVTTVNNNSTVTVIGTLIQ